MKKVNLDQGQNYPFALAAARASEAVLLFPAVRSSEEIFLFPAHRVTRK